MRFTLLCLAFTLTACGGSTDVQSTRYNFAVVAGQNQKAAAGEAQLAQKITAQLTRDPQGEFSALDFLLPTKAYAQGISLAGDPVVGAIVCGREALPGEPQVQPLCAFTLADGKAANTVVPGTKAGTYNVVFTAQNVGTEPVKDSTTVIVEAGPIALNTYTEGFSTTAKSPFEVDYVGRAIQDQYGNSIPYRLVPSGLVHTVSDTLGALSARTLIAEQDGKGSISVLTATGTIATGVLTVSGTGTSNSQIRLDFTSAP